MLDRPVSVWPRPVMAVLAPLLVALVAVLAERRAAEERACERAERRAEECAAAGSEIASARVDALTAALDGWLLGAEAIRAGGKGDEGELRRLLELARRVSSELPGALSVALHDGDGRALAGGAGGVAFVPGDEGLFTKTSSGLSFWLEEGGRTRLVRRSAGGAEELVASVVVDLEETLGAELRTTLGGTPGSLELRLGAATLHIGGRSTAPNEATGAATRPLAQGLGEVRALVSTDEEPGSRAAWDALFGIALLLSLASLLVLRSGSGQSRKTEPQERARRPGAVGLGIKQDELLTELRSRLRKAQTDLERMRRRMHKAALSRRNVLNDVSHETRTTLSAIIGLVRILGRSGLDEAQTSHVQTVRESAESLLMLLDSTLDLARIELGVLELEERPFSLDTLIGDVLEIAHPRALAKSIELSAVPCVEAPRELLGDFARLRRILLRLVFNGVHSTSEGEVVVAVRCTPEDQGRVRLTLEVSDTGVGMSAERVERMFDFPSGENLARAEVNASNDTGFAVGRAIARRLAGDLTVESDPGAGTTLRLEVAVTARGDVPALEPERGLAGRRVLVVDARQGARVAARAILTGLGVEHAEAEEGSLALNVMRAAVEAGRPFDAVLIATNLVGLGWERLTKKALRNHIHDGTGVVLLLPSSMTLADAPLRDAGVSGWIAKPLRARDVRAELLRTLGRHACTEPPPDVVRSDLDVLVVEDDAANREVLALQLVELGANVDVAGDGREAVEAVGLKRYDLVLLDHRLPGLSGLEVVRRIRSDRDPRVARLPVVGLTAGAFDEDLPRCEEAGMDDLLQLPAGPEDLSGVLERWGARAPQEPVGEAAAPAAGGARDAVDRGALRCLLGLEEDGADDLLVEVVQLFLRDTPRRLLRLSAALAAEDWPAVEDIACGLRFSSAQVGAKPLSDLCKRLGESGRSPGEADRAASLFEALRAEFGRVRGALDELSGTP